MTTTANTTGAQANNGAAQATATRGEANQTTAGVTTGVLAGSPVGGQPPPPPPQGRPGNPLPGSYVEYYTLRRDLDLPLLNVMDAFQSTARNDPQVAIKTHVELNADLISTRDSTHHGYVMLAQTDKQLVVVHRLAHYQAPLGVPNEVWHQKNLCLHQRRYWKSDATDHPIVCPLSGNPCTLC
jgi:hypothetical protein